MSASVRDLPLLADVALLDDQLDLGLVRGQVGTVVERLSPGVVEVEFSGDESRTYALVPIRSDCLLRLLHEPSEAA